MSTQKQTLQVQAASRGFSWPALVWAVPLDSQKK